MENQIMPTDRSQWPVYLREFEEAFNSAKEGIVRAAYIYAKAIKEDPERAKEFRAALSNIAEPAWRMFDDIGNDRIDARLIVGNPGPHKTRIQRQPVPVQKRILDGEKFDLLVGEGDILKVDVKQVTSDQAAQLFGPDSIRTIPEQKLWLMDKAQKAKLTRGEPEESVPWDLREGGKVVVFRKNTRMTLSQLKDLVQMMAMK